MWHINIYLAVITRSNGRPNQSSGCAIILDGACDRATASREIAQYLDNKNQPQSEIYSAIAALTAIRDRGRAKITLHTNSTYLVKLLTKNDGGEWGEATKNQGLVSKLRESYTWFTDPMIIFDNISDRIKQAAELAKTTVSDKLSSDSGTVITEAA